MNKYLNVIGILLLLLFFPYCGRREVQQIEAQGGRAHAALTEIDSLMWHQPDSAFALLLDFASSPKADSLDVFNGHYCQMLISELLYKNDYEQSNRPDLLQAVVYFDSLLLADTRGVSLRESGRRDASHASVKNAKNVAPTFAFLDARAHYINGVGYYEQDDVVNACAEYLKTLEVMEEHFGDKELVGHKARFMAYTYNRLGYMFEEQLLAEPAIVCYKQALYYCKREPTSIYGISVLLYELGLQFDITGKKDSAAIYYDKALAYMPDNDNIHYRDVMANKALLAYNTGFCTDSVIKDLKYVVSLAPDVEEKTTRFLTIGNILFEEKQYDSSRFYLETVFEQQEDIQSKILTAENLCKIYQIKGDSIQAHQYSTFLADFTMKEIEKKTDVSRINEMFKKHLIKKQEKQAEIAREKAIKKVIAVLIPIAVMVALVIIIFAKLRGKKLLQDKEKHHQREIESERQTHRMEQAAISGRLKRSNQEVRELKDQIKQQNDRMVKTESAASFTEEPICQLIMQRVNEGQFKAQMDCAVYKDYALGKEQVTALREAADRHFNQFTSRLAKAYPDLTRGDLDYCCLYLLGLSDADIAALMQKAYPTVSQRARKMKGIFGSDEPIATTLSAIAHPTD